MNKKTIFFDLDNVICSTNKNRNYSKSRPKIRAIKTVNELYERGHIIKIYTARGMGKFDGKKELVKKKYYTFTKNQLNKWRVKYHQLLMCKPSYDIFVDDKCYGYDSNWTKYVLKKFK